MEIRHVSFDEKGNENEILSFELVNDGDRLSSRDLISWWFYSVKLAKDQGIKYRVIMYFAFLDFTES